MHCVSVHAYMQKRYIERLCLLHASACQLHTCTVNEASCVLAHMYQHGATLANFLSSCFPLPNHSYTLSCNFSYMCLYNACACLPCAAAERHPGFYPSIATHLPAVYVQGCSAGASAASHAPSPMALTWSYPYIDLKISKNCNIGNGQKWLNLSVRSTSCMHAYDTLPMSLC